MTFAKYYSLSNYWRIDGSGNKLQHRRWRCSITTSSHRQTWRWQHLTTGEHITRLPSRLAYTVQHNHENTDYRRHTASATMPGINVSKDASTDRLYTNVTVVGDKKTSCSNVSGFCVVCGVPGQTQPCKVLKNEIVIVMTNAPVATTKQNKHQAERTTTKYQQLCNRQNNPSYISEKCRSHVAQSC